MTWLINSWLKSLKVKILHFIYLHQHQGKGPLFRNIQNTVRCNFSALGSNIGWVPMSKSFSLPASTYLFYEIVLFKLLSEVHLKFLAI